MSDDYSRIYRLITQQWNVGRVLYRMRTLGFWPKGQGLPPDPPEEALERKQIDGELAELKSRSKSVKNPEQVLAKERQRRWEESKSRRATAKSEQEQRQKARRVAWNAVRSSTLVHAGEGVSAGLGEGSSDSDALQRRGLPIIHRAEGLADRIGISIAELRWLTYHRRGAVLVHYHRYEIAKKTGGVRCISAPKPKLAKAQRWVFEAILKRIKPTAEAHGFVPERSIVTNASNHLGKKIVINLDLKDFFPTITFQRVKGLFRSFGYGGQVATALALLCTEPPRVATTFDEKKIYVALGDRVLPQGACTSPAITNAICQRLDRRLKGLAARHEFAYTRYADDLTFSGDRTQSVGRLLRSVRSILRDEGFVEHPTKTRVMRRNRRQEVTGLTVNDLPSLPRTELRALRAILYNASKYGLESQNRHGVPSFEAQIRGRVAFASMVRPDRADELFEALRCALAGPNPSTDSSD